MTEREQPQRKPEESLTEYISRLETLADSQRVRIHPDYIDEHGNLLVKPTIIYGSADDGTPHALVSGDGGQLFPNEDHVFVGGAATVATQMTLQPASPKIYYLYGIWVVQAATAAGRNWQPYITDGTNQMTMTGGVDTNIASGATAQVWPIKASDDAKACLPPFPISNAYYLEMVDDMAAAETATVYTAYVLRTSELGAQP
jgi:hypothetical protein